MTAKRMLGLATRSAYCALAVMVCSGSHAAEFLFDGGVVYSGTQNVVLRIIDQLPAELVGAEPAVVERIGETINVYVRATTSPTSGASELQTGATLGPMPDPAQVAVNYYLATRNPGGEYGAYQLRKSQPLVVITFVENSPIVEFFHEGLQHYFITSDIHEIEVLDNGTLLGWKRTGAISMGYTTVVQNPSLASTCRYYGLPSAGLNTHFYSDSALECAYVATTWPDKWVQETPRAFDVIRLSPETGRCPSDTVVATRFFNGKPDVNHRYVVTAAAELEMTSKGWIREGGVWCTKVVT